MNEIMKAIFVNCETDTIFSNKEYIMMNDGNEYEPRHDKPSKVTVRPAKTQISLGIRPV